MRNPFGAPKPPSETTFAPMTRFRNCATPNSQLHPILNLKGRPSAQFESQKNHIEAHRPHFPQTFTECLCKVCLTPPRWQMIRHVKQQTPISQWRHKIEKASWHHDGILAGYVISVQFNIHCKSWHLPNFTHHITKLRNSWRRSC